MGEEAKQEQVKTEAKPVEKAEEKKEENKEDKKPEEEEKKEEPKPPSPLVLFVDLHCVGCAKKIERSITKIRGVEGVAIDMVQNQVTIKGIVEPQAVCNMIVKKTKRRAQVLSPLPEAEGQKMAEVISQVSGPSTVELNVDMHCEACAEQLKRKILKMRGVQTATTELSTGKVTVTGTMEANKLVDYVYRRTKKQAKIVPQPEPEPEKKAEEKPGDGEEKPDDEKKEGEGKTHEEAKKEEGEKDSGNPDKKETVDNEAKKELVGEEIVSIYNFDEENMKRMVYYYQPLYVIERFPPQLFSDENPNACSIC